MKLLQLTLWLICLTTPWTTLHADPWGRLFTTPSQRAQLDSGQTEAANTGNSSGDAPQNATIEPIRLTGTLTGSRGKQAVWLNGKPVTQGVRVLGAGQVHLRVTPADKPRLMKSGQLLDPQTGEIIEGYAVPRSSPTDITTQTEPDPADAPM